MMAFVVDGAQGQGAKCADGNFNGNATYSQHWLRSKRRADAVKRKDTLICKLQQDKIALSHELAVLKARFEVGVEPSPAVEGCKKSEDCEDHVEVSCSKPLRIISRGRLGHSSKTLDGTLAKIEEKIDVLSSIWWQTHRMVFDSVVNSSWEANSVLEYLVEDNPGMLNADAAVFIPEHSQREFRLNGEWEALEPVASESCGTKVKADETSNASSQGQQAESVEVSETWDEPSGVAENDCSQRSRRVWRKHSRMVNVRFFEVGSRMQRTMKFVEDKPLGPLLNQYCDRYELDRRHMSFQVRAEEIEEQETWVELRKRHDDVKDLEIEVDSIETRDFSAV